MIGKRLLFAAFVGGLAVFAPVPAHAFVPTQVLVIAGTGNGMELVQAMAAAFTANNPSIRMVVPPSTHTSGGIAALLEGEASLARIGRALTSEEEKAGLRSTAVARIPSAIIVHPSVTVRDVTTRQLVDLFSGRIRNWRELGGPDLRVRIVRRKETDATLSHMRAQVPGWDTLRFPERSKLATTVQEAIAFVGRSPGAIGFTSYGRELDSHLGVLHVDGRHPFEDDYPWSATLYLAYRDTTATPDSKRFIAFWQTETARNLAKRLGAKLIKH